MQETFLPSELFEIHMEAGVKKAALPVYKLVFSGILAGFFIAIGGAASSAAVYQMADPGLAKWIAGMIFPVGLILVVLAGGELFTGDCLMVSCVIRRKISVLSMVRVLGIVWFSNFLGAVMVSVLVYYSGMLDATSGALDAYFIQTAYQKVQIGLPKAICSGILCNILVCFAVLAAAAARSVTGKIWAIFFPIMSFVICGFEHCVANMFSISVGLLAGGNTVYAAKAEELYGISSAMLEAIHPVDGLLQNLVFVTIGNILGGMVFVACPLYIIHQRKKRGSDAG